MNKTLVVGALIASAALAALIYVSNDSIDEPSTPAPPTAQARSALPAMPGDPQSAASDAASQSAHATSQPADPRLAALAVSRDNGLIEFVPGADGKIIKEIDNDPNSPGYRKPSREYLYAEGRVIGLVAYQYFSDHVQITRTQVMYKPDGSVDRYSESTSYDYRASRPAQPADR